MVPERYGIKLNASSYCGIPQGAQSLVENELRKGGATDIMEKIQDAMRTLLASALVQCCEALEERLVRWRKGHVTSRRTRT
jgi:hypothetical protein